MRNRAQRVRQGQLTVRAARPRNHALLSSFRVDRLLLDFGGPSKIIYSYAEAGAQLDISAAWLKKHKARLPHRALGARIGFSAEDIAEIKDMHAVRTAGPGGRPRADLPQALLDLKPAPRYPNRRRNVE